MAEVTCTTRGYFYYESMALGDTRQSQVDALVGALAAALRPNQIYLFGSQAKGTASSESDWDIYVVVPDDGQRVYDKTQLAYRALRGFKVPKDLIVAHASLFTQRSEWLGSLEREVRTTGRLVYGA